MRFSRFCSRLVFAVLIALALWVSGVASVIEIKNAQADYYLPRQDHYDGKWRISRWNTPRDQLRGLIHSVGLLQYPLTLLIILVAPFQAFSHWPHPRGRWSLVCGLLGLAAWFLAFHREYLSSLQT